MLLERKLLTTKQDNASRDTFILFSFNTSKQFMPKNQSPKIEKLFAKLIVMFEGKVKVKKCTF
jgi:hypothetical protein